MSFSSAFRLLVLFVAVVAGCTSGEGDPCKEENDCSGTLVCCKDSALATVRGTCEVTCEDDMIDIDGGDEEDAALQSDAASPPSDAEPPPSDGAVAPSDGAVTPSDGGGA